MACVLLWRALTNPKGVRVITPARTPVRMWYRGCITFGTGVGPLAENTVQGDGLTGWLGSRAWEKV